MAASSLQLSCLPRSELCVLCVMVLGVPVAIIPEHSQAEPGGGSHLSLLFLMDNLEGAGVRERLEEKRGGRIQLGHSPSSGNSLLKGSSVSRRCENVQTRREKRECCRSQTRSKAFAAVRFCDGFDPLKIGTDKSN